MTTLAYVQSAELWATAFAGINSSVAEQKAGKNEHLRSFLLEYPPRKKRATGDANAESERAAESKGPTKALGRTSVFTPDVRPKKETYQRLLRLSKKSKENRPRMGVVATGLASEGEVVAFSAESSRPSSKDVRARFNLGEKVEAADVDITSLEPSEKTPGERFRLAYCTDYDIYVTDLDYNSNEKAQLDPHRIFGVGPPDAFASGPQKPKFRSLRFLTATLLLVVQNLPKGQGSELLLLEISGIVTLKKKLHKKIKSATGLAISMLPYPDDYNLVQHVIAIAGADTSVTLLTLDHPPSPSYGRLAFRNFHFLPAVHPLSIMSIALSTHKQQDTPWSTTPPQYIKVATTSIANACVVQSFPLTPFPVPPPDDMPVHYLLNSPNSTRKISENIFSVLVAIFAIAFGAFFLQVFTEIRGGVPEYLGAKSWLSPTLHDWLARPYMFDDGISIAWSRSITSEIQEASSYVSVATEAVSSVASSATAAAEENVNPVAQKLGLRDLLAQRNTGSDTSDAGSDPNAHDIIIRHLPPPANSGEEVDTIEGNSLGGVTIDTRPPGAQESEDEEGPHGPVKRWEDLEHHERESWKRRLVEAGEWTLDEGETILKGVLFSGLAGAVGGAVGGAMD